MKTCVHVEQNPVLATERAACIAARWPEHHSPRCGWCAHRCPETHPDEFATVPLHALRALVDYADEKRVEADADRLASADEHRASDEEIVGLVGALRVPGLLTEMRRD